LCADQVQAEDTGPLHTALPSGRLTVNPAARNAAAGSDADAALMPDRRAMSPVVCPPDSRRSTAARA
jgi:hypothetical protein